MADTLPSPPTSRESTPLDLPNSNSDNNLTRRLDELLEQYLEVLDEYTVLREHLSKTFSDGFMSLAHAQRTSNLGPGRRYGPDGYDERMKALKRIEIRGTSSLKNAKVTSTNSNTEANTTMIPGFKNIKVVDFKHGSTPNAELENTVQRPAEPVIEEKKNKEEKAFDTHDARTATASPNKSRVDPAYRDPVTWYGILVPQALRQAKKSFSSSVEDTIPKLISTTALLTSIESEVRELRIDLSVCE